MGRRKESTTTSDSSSDRSARSATPRSRHSGEPADTDVRLDDMTAITGQLLSDPCSQERGTLTFSAPSIGTHTLDIEYLSPPVYFQVARDLVILGVAHSSPEEGT
jgi:hypothetical protein